MCSPRYLGSTYAANSRTGEQQIRAEITTRIARERLLQWVAA